MPGYTEKLLFQLAGTAWQQVIGLGVPYGLNAENSNVDPAVRKPTLKAGG